MPIYEYECNACGARHEFIQKFSEGAKRKCPDCGKIRLRKLVSAAAFHLKGDGWYVTDFRDKNKKKDGADGKGASDDGGKTETKSAEKTGDAKSDGKKASDSGGDTSGGKSAGKGGGKAASA